MKKAVLITGAAGQTGKQALLEYADGEKASYIVANDLTPEFRIPASTNTVTYSAIKANLCNPEELGKITEVLRNRPEEEILILHIGAIFRYDIPWTPLYEANVLGTKNVAEAIALPLQESGKKVKLIFWSAGAVYGEFNNPKFSLPAKENYPLDPKSDYAKTKQIAENWLLDSHRKNGLWVSAMRCGAIYAPGGTYGMANAITLMFLGMLEPLAVGNGKNRVALVHARDTVRIADFLSDQEEANGKIYNVRDNSAYTLEEITKIQSEAIGLKPFKHFRMDSKIFFEKVVKPAAEKAKKWGVPTTIDTELAKMMILDSYIDITALKNLFEKARVSFESYLKYPDSALGLQEVVEWYRKNWKEWEAYV